MTTIRLTAAQAAVRWLAPTARRDPPGRGPVLRRGLGDLRPRQCRRPGRSAARRPRRACRPGAPTTNRRMAHAAIAYAKAVAAPRAAWSAPPRSAPARPTWSPPPRLAHVNRLPVLFLPGDVYASRAARPGAAAGRGLRRRRRSRANDCFEPGVALFRPHRPARTDPRRHCRAPWRRADRSRRLRPGRPSPSARTSRPKPSIIPIAFFEQARLAHRAGHAPDPRANWTTLVAPIKAAKPPLIVAGGGVLYAGRRGRACAPSPGSAASPVAETQGGKGALAWDHPLQPRQRRRHRHQRRQRRSPRPPTWSSGSARGCRTSPPARGPCSPAEAASWSRINVAAFDARTSTARPPLVGDAGAVIGRR